MSTDQLNALLHELKNGLISLYGNQLVNVYLYGSYARGEQVDQSDLDVMVVLVDYSSYGRELDRVNRLTGDLSLKYGVSISTVFLRQKEWLETDTPLLRNVRVDALAV